MIWVYNMPCTFLENLPRLESHFHPCNSHRDEWDGQSHPGCGDEEP